jgi:NADPH-dependent curcumin reductase CurA
MKNQCRAVVLARRPSAQASVENFAIVEWPMPRPASGEVLTRTLWLSIDPYMRGRMSDDPSYAAPVQIGQPMTGETVGEVIASEDPSFRPGQIVVGARGWQTHLSTPGASLTVLDLRAPVQTHLGVLGMPGATAFAGLRDIGRPHPGETVVASAASGAVGSVVVQLAKRTAARVVGIAGGPEKCRWVCEELGADACIDYRATQNLSGALSDACPNGVDVYFENVGGAVQLGVFPLLNNFGRVVMCGMIAEYEDGPNRGPNLFDAVRKRLHIQGFIVLDRPANFSEWRTLGSALVVSGELKYREQIVEGLENAPGALISLLRGQTEAKLVVRVAEPSARAS